MSPQCLLGANCRNCGPHCPKPFCSLVCFSLARLIVDLVNTNQKDATSMVTQAPHLCLFTSLLLKSGHEGLLQQLGFSRPQPTISAIVHLWFNSALPSGLLTSLLSLQHTHTQYHKYTKAEKMRKSCHLKQIGQDMQRMVSWQCFKEELFKWLPITLRKWWLPTTLPLQL